ncbi:lactonase family protein [Flavobacterium sp. J27]|uniref:lactonase family protein n=1 Tax=Flavobacterium sp. J27 TaxID=2060419 RepID=UPI00103073B6|nr:lactonase family protein [Flavobacterium sp. J27]
MNKKIVSSIYIALFALVSCKKEKTTESNVVSKEVEIISENYLIGTYTDSLSQGINLISFFPDKQKVVLKYTIDSLLNPSFVVSNDSKSIFASVGEIQSENGGLLHTFSYDKEKQLFQKISTVPSLGDDPCTLAFSPNEKAIVVGNYSGGNLAVYPITKTGEIINNPKVIQHEGNSVTKERQEKAHVHCVVFHPNEKSLFVADLGNDTIDIIPFIEDENEFVLYPEETISTKMPLGSGPRHIVFNKEGNTLYVVFELTNEVAVFDYSEHKLQLNKVISLTDKETRLGSAAEIKLSNDNQFLYVSVRGEDNQLVVLKTNNGITLEKIQTIPTELSPRNFILSDKEDFVLVANQGSNTIVVYTRDPKTGLLQETKNKIDIHKPVYFCKF